MIPPTFEEFRDTLQARVAMLRRHKVIHPFMKKMPVSATRSEAARKGALKNSHRNQWSTF